MCKYINYICHIHARIINSLIGCDFMAQITKVVEGHNSKFIILRQIECFH